MNLTKRTFISYCTTHLGCLLMGGIFLLSFCGTEYNNNDSKEGNNTTPEYLYLLLGQSKLNKITIPNTVTNYTFPFTLKRQNSNTNFKVTTQPVPWSEEELNRYNRKESSSYALLPPELYSVTPSNIILNSGISQISVDIRFNPAIFFTKFKETNTKYIIPLKLESDEVRSFKSQRDLTLEITFNYPKVKFISSDVTSVSVNKEITMVEIPIAFKYMVNEKSIGNLWNFPCKLTILENADESVIAFNQSHNTGYELLPQSSFTLKGTINYKTGDTQEIKILSIVRKEEQKIKKYLLPFT